MRGWLYTHFGCPDTEDLGEAQEEARELFEQLLDRTPVRRLGPAHTDPESVRRVREYTAFTVGCEVEFDDTLGHPCKSDHQWLSESLPFYGFCDGEIDWWTSSDGSGRLRPDARRWRKAQ
jgi:hypothetical protein